MALSSKVRRILLLENSFLRRRLLTKKKKRIGVHEMNKKRSVLGEFHHVYEELRSRAIFQILTYVNRNF